MNAIDLLETPHSDVGHFAEARRRAAFELQTKLFAEMVERRPGAQCFYIPEDRKGKIITHAAIQEQCPVGVDSRYVENVHNLGRNLFAILGYIGQAPDLCAFIDEGLTDADLPFVYQSATGILTRKDGTEIRSSKDWESATRFAFVRDQWNILTPIFSDKEHYQFHDNTILPFTHEELVSKGAYSEMYEATIHSAHHHWHQGPDQSPLSVAIKKLHFHDEDEFEKERTILVALEGKKNNHLVKLLFSYEYRGIYHLVFRRATGNLRKFWELNPDPQFIPDTILWSLRQMIGITQGLRIIHNFKVTIPLSVTEVEMETPQGKAIMSVSNGEERFGRHGDLKPENILWFHDFTGDVCQITDFGLGRFHGRDTRTKAAPYTIYSSPTYEPPECHIYLPVSRAYDLWSLGCLFLEWVSWMLAGWQAIEDFSRSRVEQSLIMNQDGAIYDDYFWSFVVEGNNRNARVRDGVEQWVLKLRQHPKCSQLIHDVLSLIMQDLLCIVPSRRSSAASLHNDLGALVSRAERDHGYALDPCPEFPSI
ncbi:Protein kinase domain-containing protein [Lasiodiplodia theobromae]|uniref:Protein kinase domain-containing protein n=1 Tax=Lasiodiplodia theobromae TaxID=45133 RepID=UPI0015C33D4A|nr:Protein kinase domain-containing protein [Lasiodiplodia theobromae]KAF4544497.1 Protein kinase domain-containing protein [Lasiodiplodia theobromae]